MSVEFYITLGRYMYQNPAAENPVFYRESLGVDVIEDIIKKAKFNFVSFELIQDKNGQIVTDLIVPFVEGQVLKGFEPDLEEWTVFEEPFEDLEE